MVVALLPSTYSLASAPPVSFEQAEAEADRLLTEIEEIQAQLTDGNRVDRDGQRLTFTEWCDWRQAALAAHRKKVARRRFVKRWIRDQQHVPGGSVELMQDLVDLVEDLDNPAASVLTPGQLQVLNDARGWLLRKTNS